MIKTALDLYDAAFLAGGTGRVVDAAVVTLVDSRRVRVDGEGRLTAVDPVRRHPVEAAVLDAIGTRGLRTIGLVRLRAAEDDRVAQVAAWLEGEGLVTRARRFRRGSVPVPTAAGRQALRRLRSDPPAWRTGNAAVVALGGPAQLPDEALRATLFDTDRPVRRRDAPYRGRRLNSRDGAIASAGAYGTYGYGMQGYSGGFDGGGGYGGGCDSGGGGGSC